MPSWRGAVQLFRGGRVRISGRSHREDAQFFKEYAISRKLFLRGRRLLALLRGVVLVGQPLLAAAQVKESRTTRLALPPTELTGERQILHVLNRLGCGPRAGDI